MGRKRQPQNRAVTGRTRRRSDGTFDKGISGNPGGRPSTKDLSALIGRETVNGRELVRFTLKILRGEVKRASVKERQRARDWLSDRLWGKAMQSIELTGKNGGPLQSETSSAGDLLKHYTDQELDQLEEIAKRAAARAVGAPAESGDAGSAPHPG